jgi:hypothetical protein
MGTDTLMFIIACVFWAIVLGVMTLGYVGARAWVRRVCGNNESARNGRPRRLRARDRRLRPVPPAPAGAGHP